MENIQSGVNRLLSASLAGNTHLVYDNALQAFNKFRQQYTIVDIWPVPAYQVALFVSFCFEQGYAPSTIRTYLSGISFLHKLHNWNDPTDLFVIRKLLEGCRRIRLRSDVRAPITEAILKSICLSLPFVCTSLYETKLFKAAYFLAFFGLLRVSELVHTTDILHNRPLSASDVKIESGASAVLVTIRYSKTNPYGKPITLRIPASNDRNFCCVKAVSDYIKQRPKQAINFLCHADSLPLKRSQFSGVLTKAIRNAGLPIQKFKSHSFRIGRATTLASQGIPTDIIKQLGRWKSNAVDHYIRLA